MGITSHRLENVAHKEGIEALSRHMLGNIKEKLNRNTFLKSVALIAGGTAVAQAITILSAPITTRLYTPSDFGVLTVFTAAVGIIGQLSTLRYSVTIPLADTEEVADDVLRLCFFITLCLSILSCIVVAFFGEYLAARSNAIQSQRYLWFFPICLMGIGLYEALSNWAIRRKYFKVIARTKLSQAIFSAGFKIGLGWIGVRPLGLIIGFLASQASGTINIFLRLVKDRPILTRATNVKGMIYAAKRFSNFPLYQIWSRILLALGTQLPALFMATSFGIRDAGLFGLANTMVNMPMDLIGSSVAQVYYAEIAKFGKSDPTRILKLSVSIIKKTLFLGMAPMGLILLAGPWIFSIVFGQQWHVSGIYARLLSFTILTRFISSPIMHCFDVLEMQGKQLFLNIVRVLLVVMVFFMAEAIGMTSYETILAYSLLTSVYYVVMISIALMSLRRI